MPYDRIFSLNLRMFLDPLFKTFKSAPRVGAEPLISVPALLRQLIDIVVDRLVTVSKKRQVCSGSDNTVPSSGLLPRSIQACGLGLGKLVRLDSAPRPQHVPFRLNQIETERSSLSSTLDSGIESLDFRWERT